MRTGRRNRTPFAQADLKAIRRGRGEFGFSYAGQVNRWGDHPDSSVTNVVFGRSLAVLALSRHASVRTSFVFAVTNLAPLGRQSIALLIEVVLCGGGEDKLLAAIHTNQKPRLSSIVFQHDSSLSPCWRGSLRMLSPSRRAKVGISTQGSLPGEGRRFRLKMTFTCWT